MKQEIISSDSNRIDIGELSLFTKNRHLSHGTIAIYHQTPVILFTIFIGRKCLLQHLFKLLFKPYKLHVGKLHLICKVAAYLNTFSVLVPSLCSLLVCQLTGQMV